MDKKAGIPWVTVAITAALAVFYAVWFTHAWTVPDTPLGGAIATILVGLVPIGTFYVLSRLVSLALGKPYDSWTTEDRA